MARSLRQRDEAQSALRDREARLRAILDTAVEGIITIDDHGIIESTNPAAATLFGYPLRELIGRNVSMLMPAPYHREHDGYLARYLRTGHAKIIGSGREVVGRRKDGTIFPMELAVSEVRLPDRRLFTGFVRDISERKQLQKQLLEVSDREQRRFGQDLHDGLGQHLTGIQLMTEVLARSLAARSKPAAAQAAKIAGHVRTAIEQTRLLARGLAPVVLESGGLMGALQELAQTTRELFRVACELRCDPPVLLEDSAAATHLYRIAQEAVTNAIRHGKARGIVLELARENDQLVLRITDDGRGFGNADTGKGMGLQTMRHRAGLLGGSLDVEQKSGAGATITCRVSPPAGKNRKARRT